MSRDSCQLCRAASHCRALITSAAAARCAAMPSVLGSPIADETVATEVRAPHSIGMHTGFATAAALGRSLTAPRAEGFGFHPSRTPSAIEPMTYIESLRPLE
jgi:hypothetical protein